MTNSVLWRKHTFPIQPLDRERSTFNIFTVRQKTPYLTSIWHGWTTGGSKKFSNLWRKTFPRWQSGKCGAINLFIGLTRKLKHLYYPKIRGIQLVTQYSTTDIYRWTFFKLALSACPVYNYVINKHLESWGEWNDQLICPLDWWCIKKWR